MGKYIFARHGKTVWNDLGKLQGWSNSPLNDDGLKQAQALAVSLTSYDIGHIVASPLQRAEHTATIIAEHIGFPTDQIVFDGRLKECRYGELEGLTWDEIEAKYDVHREHMRAHYDFRPYGGESKQEVTDRVLALVHEWEQKQIGKTILFIGHGGSGKILLNHVGLTDVVTLENARFFPFDFLHPGQS